MHRDLAKIIADIFFEDYKDKMILDESIEDYFKKMPKNELEKILHIYYLIKDNTKLLSEFIVLNGKKKNETVNYFIENYEEIYENIFKYLGEDIITQLDHIVNHCKDGYLKTNILIQNYSISFFLTLKSVGILNIRYSKKNGDIEAYIQKDILEVIKKSLDNKKIIKESKEISKINDSVSKILNVYGILPLSKLNDIINRIYKKVDKSKLFNNICINSIITREINIFKDEEDYLVSNHNFEDEDEVFTFYYSLDEKTEYKEFTKKEFDEFNNQSYHHKFKQYLKLKDFILDTFDMTEMDFKQFDNDLVMDYIYSYQSDPEEAKAHLKNNLDSYFENIDSIDKACIMKEILDIAVLCPTFYLKGYATCEEKIKDSIINM